MGVDVDKIAIKSAGNIISKNKLEHVTEVRYQGEDSNILLNVLRRNENNGNEIEKFECTFCNPPFHSNIEECNKNSNRKWTNLNRKNEIINNKPILNFGGTASELVYEQGGEMGFLRKMIKQSAHPTIRGIYLFVYFCIFCMKFIVFWVLLQCSSMLHDVQYDI